MLHEYIKNGTIPRFMAFEYYFVNYTRANDTANHELYPPKNYRRLATCKDFDLAAKFFFSMDFFLQSTHARWLLRFTDDTVINWRTLGPFFESLERRYDPMRDRVFMGNCIRQAGVFYAQGGSGFLLSRAAAEVAAPLRRRYFRDFGGPEDLSMGSFFAALNMSISKSASSAFMGHSFAPGERRYFAERNWSRFPECGDIEREELDPCGRFFIPLRDLVFYHEWEGSWPQAMWNGVGMFNAPPDLFVNFRFFPSACFLRNASQLRKFNRRHDWIIKPNPLMS